MDDNGLNNEDIQWINIQDPIKQMITSITKAVRTQSAGIRDLDRKIGYLASTESTQALVESTFLKCFTKNVSIFILLFYCFIYRFIYLLFYIIF